MSYDYAYQPLSSYQEDNRLFDNSFDAYSLRDVWGRIFSFVQDPNTLKAAACTDKIFGSIVKKMIFEKYKKCLDLKYIVAEYKFDFLFKKFPLYRDPFWVEAFQEIILDYFSEIFGYLEEERELLKRWITENVSNNLTEAQLNEPINKTLFIFYQNLKKLLTKHPGEEICKLEEKIKDFYNNRISLDEIIQFFHSLGKTTILAIFLNQIEKYQIVPQLEVLKEKILYNPNKTDLYLLKQCEETERNQNKCDLVSYCAFSGLVTAVTFILSYACSDRNIPLSCTIPPLVGLISYAYCDIRMYRSSPYSYSLTGLFLKALYSQTRVEPNFANMV